jgi:hypothetical protein
MFILTRESEHKQWMTIHPQRIPPFLDGFPHLNFNPMNRALYIPHNVSSLVASMMISLWVAPLLRRSSKVLCCARFNNILIIWQKTLHGVSNHFIFVSQTQKKKRLYVIIKSNRSCSQKGAINE